MRGAWRFEVSCGVGSLEACRLKGKWGGRSRLSSGGLVTQIFNLPYRRFLIGRGLVGRASCKLSSVLQNEILRYGRLKICVTSREPILLREHSALTRSNLQSTIDRPERARD